ncbi:homoserine dehydrogenase [Formosimonas limnophila]|uniref:Homoserine dehydrogenase n=1 Tax=Formosimonas limnophila TaxID=1384487 RepID=A0A8J3CL83_9BURK|nr:homoserine dehydrogenase [Formosimonas limnophila]GHA65354.1 homoserine dehydrogenase [Formosimonas limnophila]
MKPIKIGIAGTGVVASGVVNILKRNADEITRRAGRDIEVIVVSSRTRAKAEALVGNDVQIVNDIMEVARHPDVDIVVETMGGYEPAKSFVLEAIAHGKHVVTANKALLAEHGNEIFKAAQDKGVTVAFEAAVAGGIPVIKALREGLSANRIEWIAGIINGTTNFILTQMREKGWTFADALKVAQELGYAEADPTFDVEGVDAAHKITLMSALAFGVPIDFKAASIEGISKLAAADIAYAEKFGYRIKLLGITKRVSNGTTDGIELRVHPTLIPESRLIANVNGVMNAVLVKGDAVGATLYYGAGAGSEPTGSSVIADLIDVTRTITADPEHRVPHLAFQPDSLASIPMLPLSAVKTRYYLRLTAQDRTGVLADITRILANHDISVDAMLQTEVDDATKEAHIVIMTHVSQESNVDTAVSEIKALASITGGVVKLRVEELG